MALMSPKSRKVAFAAGAVLVLLGLPTAASGAWLIAKGGSWYYLLAGAGFLLTGALLMAGRPAALLVYAVVVLGTVAWALWETGLDWWQLAPRGDVVFLIGLGLLTPWVVRGVSPADRAPWRGLALPLLVSLLIAAAVGVAAMTQDQHDLNGALPTATGARPANYAGVPDPDWRAYGRSNFGDRYSPLAQITPDTVGKLQVAWTYHTGDMKGPNDPNETTYELTPIKVGDTVYICTPHDWAIALDAETGKERWKYDPKIDEKTNLQHLTCRGVSYHDAADRAASQGGECPQRIFLPTADARLIALDANTGKPCPGFGQNGAVDLWAGMPEARSGMYYSTSPPVVTRNLVIIAGEVTDNYSTSEPSGVIRAYDVRTGRLMWNWDPGNPDATEPIAPGQSYTKNSPNSWIVSSADEDLGLIYVPLGNQTPDQWGPDRSANTEKFASSIVALEIATGKVRWVFQTVHHDLWDMDVPSQPSLLDLDTPNGKVPALVQSTKRGDVYVLDRRTGKPIIPVDERPVPQGAVKPDFTAPTQPFSALTLGPERKIEERDMWGATMFDQLACRIKFRSLRYDGMFTPPSLQGSIVFPGNFGVIDWGGVAVDPVRQVAFANPDYMAFLSRLVPRDQERAQGKRESVQRPAGGSDVAGSKADESGANPMLGTPYSVELNAFLSPIGLPCQAPPWGYVAGLDLRSGKVVYKLKNGTVRDLAPVPLPFKMGVPSLGGPIVTAGGVAFLTSTLDYYVRAYDLTTGKVLWSDRLPAGGQATPMSYQSGSGRQFVVVVAGGHGSLGTKTGDSVIAYALPKP
ncbi:membrane-bound PQQ-dependent dehydrogenase, glucose/quinate/shikimate family [Alsobacter soli]|uniref:Membrane-bound PQQ-dependent dehydrogenase, glucose/quinate/shikimate family n=1 Tax=Alsobacter soli TaxID=2109933 RepID=A0A2T1HWL0_9HYPH|nr:glucose/quinate/shikimate family membrane-bound PQQ-dependent dehydrogenase [Alsobacter soli]PSC06004.1 membrane-bound PQQ-dependent dehydrogenase, glucose/quinate/shikimate family [Alsobacter soli]